MKSKKSKRKSPIRRRSRKMSSVGNKRPAMQRPEDVKRVRGADGQVISFRNLTWADLDAKIKELQQAITLRREQQASGALYPGWEDLGDDTVEIRRAPVLLSPETRQLLAAAAGLTAHVDEPDAAEEAFDY